MDTKKFSVKFTIVTKDEHGITGAMPSAFVGKWDSYIPGFSPSHDIIEHGKKETGKLYQEIHALGAVLHTRGWEVEEGWQAGKSYALLMGSDFVSSWRDSYYADNFDELLELPKVPKFSLSAEDKERFEEFLPILKENIKDSWDAEINNDCRDEENCNGKICDDCTPNYYFENWELVKQHFMYGYYKAVKRWGSLNVYELRSAIDKAMTNFEKTHRGDLAQTEGFEFTLHCEVNNYGAEAEVILPRNHWMY